MKKQKNKAARKYYRQAKREIPLCFSSKKEYLSDLEDILEKAVLENPEISYPELTERLGTPKQQTEEYAQLLSTEQLYKNIYTARRIHRVILVVAIILTAIIGIATGIIVDKYIKSQYDVVIKQPVVVEEHESDEILDDSTP